MSSTNWDQLHHIRERPFAPGKRRKADQGGGQSGELEVENVGLRELAASDEDVARSLDGMEDGIEADEELQ